MGENQLQQYVHQPEDEDIGFSERAYQVREEILEYKGREVLYVRVESTGFTLCDRSVNSRLETGRVVGYITRWKCETNEEGEAISEIEPIEDEEIRRELRKILQQEHMLRVYF
ncbi:hypothetical protein ACFLW2_03735 [Chloroflexota bacterium]